MRGAIVIFSFKDEGYFDYKLSGSYFLRLANLDFQINDDYNLALFHLGSWRGLLPRPEVLAVNMLGRGAQLVHELLVVD